MSDIQDFLHNAMMPESGTEDFPVCAVDIESQEVVLHMWDVVLDPLFAYYTGTRKCVLYWFDLLQRKMFREESEVTDLDVDTIELLESCDRAAQQFFDRLYGTPERLIATVLKTSCYQDVLLPERFLTPIALSEYRDICRSLDDDGLIGYRETLRKISKLKRKSSERRFRAEEEAHSAHSQQRLIADNIRKSIEGSMPRKVHDLLIRAGLDQAAASSSMAGYPPFGYRCRGTPVRHVGYGGHDSIKYVHDSGDTAAHNEEVADMFAGWAASSRAQAASISSSVLGRAYGAYADIMEDASKHLEAAVKRAERDLKKDDRELQFASERNLALLEKTRDKTRKIVWAQLFGNPENRIETWRE